MYPLQWMGAVRMRVQTTDKNITIIHTTPVHQLTSCGKLPFKLYTAWSAYISLLTHDVFIEESNTMDKDLYFSQKQHFEVKNFLMMDCFL